MKQYIKKGFIFLVTVVFIISCVCKEGGNVGKTSITKWQKDKKSAISITYDDGTINQFTVARPIMNKLNLPGTFYIITGKIKGSSKGKFIGRPFSEIIKETILVKTDTANFFERASAIGFIGKGEAIDYHSNAGSLFESGKIREAHKLIDEGYEKIRKGELKVSNKVVFHDNKEIDSTTWEDYKIYANEGHEIASHTVTHPRLAILDKVNMLYELDQSRIDIQKFLGEAYTFSAECPYGTEDERVMKCAHSIYPALRNRMPESYIEELNRACNIDPSTLGKEYIQWQRGVLTNTSMKVMKKWVNTSITRNNIWLVLVFHGVDNIGWEPKTGKELEEYFGYIKKKEDVLWVATFADVSKYVKERKNTTVSSEVKDNKILLTILSDLDTKMYNVPITMKTYVPKKWKLATLEKKNNNALTLNVKKDSLGSYVLYDVLPNTGSMVLIESN